MIVPLYSLLPIPDTALVALTFVWGVIGWAFMAPQQSRIVSLDAGEPERVAVAERLGDLCRRGDRLGGRRIGHRPSRLRRARLDDRPRARRGARPYPADDLAELAERPRRGGIQPGGIAADWNAVDALRIPLAEALMAPRDLFADEAELPDVGPNTTIAALREEAAHCTRCHLYKHATQTVFGEGP